MEEKKLKPKLRFQGFQDEWETRNLNNIADVTSSKRVYLSDYVKEGIPFFRGKEITELQRKLKPSDILYIKESKFEEYKNKYGIPKKNDILITSVGTLGNVYRIDIDYPFYFKDGNLIWLRNPNISSPFLEISLSSNKRNLLKGVIGSTQKALTIEGIKKVEIKVPSSHEQTKIASFVTEVDSYIENLKQQKEAFEKYKKGMMQKIFSQQIRFKEENGEEFPEWEEKSLKDTIEFLSDYTANGSFASLKENVKYFSDENYAALVRTTDLEKRKFIPERFTDERGYMYLKKTSLYGGEIILSNVGNIGKVYKAPTYSKPMTLAPNTYMIRFNQSYNKEFMFQWMLTKEFKNKTLSMVGGGGLTAINKINLRSIKGIFPKSIIEQNIISDFLSKQDKSIKLKQQQIENAEQWKKGLLQQLFI